MKMFETDFDGPTLFQVSFLLDTRSFLGNSIIWKIFNKFALSMNYSPRTLPSMVCLLFWYLAADVVPRSLLQFCRSEWHSLLMLLQSENICSPTVSIVIPTFNRATLLSESISSVLRQSYSNFEVIVVDDGSTDSTVDVVNSFPDQRLIFLKQENKGRSAARNRAIAQARGRYIAFLDSDDVYLEGKLERQIDYMDSHPEMAMTYTSALCIDGKGDLLPQKYEATVSGKIHKDIAFFIPVTITLPTVMVRREVFQTVGSFDEAMYRFEDTDMWRRISKSYNIGAIQEYTCKLRTHDGNCLTAQDPDQISYALDYYASKILREDCHLNRYVLRKGLAGIYFYYGGAIWRMPRWHDKGLKLLITAFRYWPLVFASPSILRYFLVNSARRILSNAVSASAQWLSKAKSASSKKSNRVERDIAA
jgi:glycosyltransferase involved in cell wall biosynthesis